MTKRCLWRGTVIGVATVLLGGPLAGGAHAAEVVVGGQYRPRLEVDNKTLGTSEEDVVVSHRARLMVTVRQGDWRIQVDPQQVLSWGSEAHTLAPAFGTLDFHQAFVEGPLGAVKVRVGRQEIVLDDHRLIGNVNWTQQARTFDGARLFWSPGDALQTTAFAAYLKEGGAKDKGLYGAHALWSFSGGSLAPLVVVERAGVDPDDTSKHDWLRGTAGARLVYGRAGVGLDLAGYYQFGGYSVGDTSYTLAAYLAAVRVSYGGGWGSIAIGADALSGDADQTDTKVQVFDTLYATNHKWYGHMDYFLNIPVHTAGLGLLDAVATFKTGLIPGAKLYLAGHLFQTMADTAAGNRDLGTEVDLNLTHGIADGVKLQWGYSLFQAGQAMADIGRASAKGDVAHWAWAQVITSF